MLNANLLPYVSPPQIPLDLPLLGARPLSVFGPIVVVGIWLGLRRVHAYGRVHGLPADFVERLAMRVLLVGFAVAHLVAMVFYHPERVIESPWILLDITSGIASTGGLLGAAIALALWGRHPQASRLRIADMLVYGMVVGFTIGRVGCALVHDHPGIVTSSDAWMAVGPWPDGAYRYDLGLIELIGCTALALWVTYRFDWRRAAPGRLSGWVAIGYGIFRFPLDALRVADRHWLGLTFAQWVALSLVAVGAWCLLRSQPSTKAETSIA